MLVSRYIWPYDMNNVIDLVYFHMLIMPTSVPPAGAHIDLNIKPRTMFIIQFKHIAFHPRFNFQHTIYE